MRALRSRRRLVLFLFVGLNVLRCSTQNADSSSPSYAANPAVTLAQMPAGDNVLPIHVGCGYVNEPCVSVQICVPGTSQCQTINNVLLDTGSYGLRLFHQPISLNLPQETDSSGNGYAECISYADGSSQWGPVVQADIVLGNVKASSVPMQVVNSTYATPPSDCTDLNTSPSADGYNGILGVGLFNADCGANCVSTSDMHVYFSCTSAGACSPATISLANQVTNPISLLPNLYNNGVILELPAVGDNGASGAIGALVLGIGTVANNTPSSTPQIFTADSQGYFTTEFQGNTYSNAFIDSGSNGLFFPSQTLTQCAGSLAGFFCPSTLTSQTATQVSASNSLRYDVTFNILSAGISTSSGNPNVVFNNLGAYASGAFDWGFPFFLGRSIYVSREGASAFSTAGPFWAY